MRAWLHGRAVHGVCTGLLCRLRRVLPVPNDSHVCEHRGLGRTAAGHAVGVRDSVRRSVHGASGHDEGGHLHVSGPRQREQRVSRAMADGTYNVVPLNVLQV